MIIPSPYRRVTTCCVGRRKNCEKFVAVPQGGTVCEVERDVTDVAELWLVDVGQAPTDAMTHALDKRSTIKY